MTFNLPLSQIDARMLESLMTDSVPEGRQLEYKEALPGNSDDDKREFLSDVTSFANSAGGDLLFGLKERREAGRPTAEIETIAGLPGLNVDAERLRFEAMIRDGIAPRMPLVSFHKISRDPDPPCLLLRVPRSWAGLHMVTYKNSSRFYSRTSAGKYQLDVHEIRAGFVAAEIAIERLRRFRTERIARALDLEAPVAIATGPKLILHALPINILNEVWPRVLTIQDQVNAGAVSIIGGTFTSWRFNLDGFVVHTLVRDLSRQCYTQLFRDGGIEALSGTVIARDEQRNGFYAWGMEAQVIAALQRYQNFWQTIGVTPPILIGLTISGVNGWKVLQNPYGFSDLDEVIDRDVISPPDVVLSDFASPPDVELRPLFDVVWNGGGWRGSPNYRDGRWVPPS